MSLSDARPSRRIVLAGLAGATMLPGCGFTPVYGPGGTAEGLRGTIAVDSPDDVAGFKLVRQLETRLGRPTSPAYRMAADIGLDREGLGITNDSEITRFRLDAVVRYTLFDVTTGQPVHSGEVSNFTSYSAPVFTADRVTAAGNAVSVRVAAEDALDRLMITLADQIVSRLLATAPTWRT